MKVRTPQPRMLAIVALMAASAAMLPVAAGEGAPGGRHAKIDANGDGAIDRTEAAAHSKLAENFDRLDKNKDGRIDASERPQRHGKGGGGKGQKGERMAKFDTNGDGRFSRDELAGRERVLQNFNTIDANQDGFLTREEMRAHHQAQRGTKRGEAR
jgi:EF hand